MLLNKLLLQKLVFIIPLLLIPQLCPETSALETEININTDDRPIMVLKDTTFTDTEIVKIDSLVGQIPLDIRDELIARYNILWDKIVEEIGLQSNPDLWSNSYAYKEFMIFLEPLGLGICPFFFKKINEKDQFSLMFIWELAIPLYEDIWNEVTSYSYYTEGGIHIPPDPLKYWMLFARKLLEMPDDIWVINTNVAVENIYNLPEDFTLEQNHPNPFNPITEIRYALPVDSRVTIRIYNILGQEVAILIDNELMQAGWHTKVWDSRDALGNNAASGIYFCRLIAGNRVMTQKIMLTR